MALGKTPAAMLERQQLGTEDTFLIQDFATLASTATVEKLRALSIASPEAPADVAQALVLTLADSSGQTTRAAPLLKLLSGDVPVKAVQGINYHAYKTEVEEMDQTSIPMDPASKKQWQEGATIGVGNIHAGQDLAKFQADGTLACVLGHHHMWEMAAGVANPGTGKGRGWTVIFEDDARPNPNHHNSQSLMASIAEVLRTTPPEAEMVMLGARHCERRHGLIGTNVDPFAPGSMAYAITATAAKALLAEPFIHASDHWLNAPVKAGKFKMFCPAGEAIFSHGYKHATSIHDVEHFKGEGVQVAGSLQQSDGWPL